MAVKLSGNQKRFAAAFARTTGLSPKLVAAQIVAEEPAGAHVPVGHNDQNWLNIGNTDSKWYGGTWAGKSPEEAGRLSGLWLMGKYSVPGFGRAAPGIRAVARSAGKPLSAQVQALQRSGWASSGYPDLPGIVNSIGDLHLPTGSGEPPAHSAVRVHTTPASTDTAAAVIAALLAQPVNAASGKLTMSQPLLQDIQHNLTSGQYTTPAVTTRTRTVTKTKSNSGTVKAASVAGLPKGLTKFEGTKVAAWIAPILQFARSKGWKGGVTSGWRSDADQTRIYNSGVRPAAVPRSLGGPGSNHEGDQFPQGAVDVSQAAQLSEILANSPYKGRLVWAGSKDPVHFSHPHNGGY